MWTSENINYIIDLTINYYTDFLLKRLVINNIIKHRSEGRTFDVLLTLRVLFSFLEGEFIHGKQRI